MALKKIRVTLDGDFPVFTAWSSGEKWNGFEVPYFEYGEAQQVAEAARRAKIASVRFDSMRRAFVTRIERDPPRYDSAQLVRMPNTSRLMEVWNLFDTWVLADEPTLRERSRGRMRARDPDEEEPDDYIDIPGWSVGWNDEISAHAATSNIGNDLLVMTADEYDSAPKSLKDDVVVGLYRDDGEGGWDQIGYADFDSVSAVLELSKAELKRIIMEDTSPPLGERRARAPAPRTREAPTRRGGPPKYRPSKAKKFLRVARVVPTADQWRVEFEDDMAIHVHGGHGRSDLFYAMGIMDLRHEHRSPGPETRRDYQYLALKSVLDGRPAEFTIDRDGDVRATLLSG